MNSGSGSSTPTLGMSDGMLMMNQPVTNVTADSYYHTTPTPAAVKLHNRMSSLTITITIVTWFMLIYRIKSYYRVNRT